MSHQCCLRTRVVERLKLNFNFQTSCVHVHELIQMDRLSLVVTQADYVAVTQMIG